jgi:hypothetical protein
MQTQAVVDEAEVFDMILRPEVFSYRYPGDSK